MATLNIASNSSDVRARKLSNFTADRFYLDGEMLASVEGFIQGIKFPEGSNERFMAFGSVGIDAKRQGQHAERKFVWWMGDEIKYGSPGHHALIERAIRARFEQSYDARHVLLATDGMNLTHDLGHPESPYTSLPAAVFCDILTRIREEVIRKADKYGRDAEGYGKHQSME